MGVSLFLDLDGIPGDSTDDEHYGDIDIQAYSWGASGNPATGPSGGGIGKISMSSISFFKAVDVASPALARASNSGQAIPQAIFYARSDPASSDLEVILTLKDVTVASYQLGGTTGGRPATESFVLMFSSFTSKYAHLSNGPIGGSLSGARGP